MTGELLTKQIICYCKTKNWVGWVWYAAVRAQNCVDIKNVTVMQCSNVLNTHNATGTNSFCMAIVTRGTQTEDDKLYCDPQFSVCVWGGGAYKHTVGEDILHRAAHLFSFQPFMPPTPSHLHSVHKLTACIFPSKRLRSSMGYSNCSCRCHTRYRSRIFKNEIKLKSRK
jgi:hypothetical protein